MKKAVILGGTGVVGRAIAGRLLAAGWAVEVTGRDSTKMPPDLVAAGGRFLASDRYSDAQLAKVLGPGTDLLVDAVCFTAAHAKQLLPHLGNVDSTVMLSSKAVYVDPAGNHVNSFVPPIFDAPIVETQETMRPGNGRYDSPEGYGPNKVAAEHVLLDCGAPVTVVRPSKVHGTGAGRPREWMFVKRVLDNRKTLLLSHGGRGGDHTTAAVNTAALVETIAAHPGRRILNSADPDAPSGLDIARTIARHLHHDWQEILLEDDAGPGLGAHPWDYIPPVVLDTGASLALGYRPVGTFAETVPMEIDWLLAVPANRPKSADPFFAPFTDYAAEDQFLRTYR
jgi:nucleoside-diphosphate-sugar epimerase